MEPVTSQRSSPAAAEPTLANVALWGRTGPDRFYAGRQLRPVEAILLARHRDALAGRVLELGCGAGRLTGYLVALAREVHAVDISPMMVAHCRRAWPEATVRVADLRHIRSTVDGPFDAILAPFNVLDVLDRHERRRVLRDVRDLVADDGLLIFSGHNRAYAPRILRPTHVRLNDPLRLGSDLLHMWRRVRNHRRLAPLEHLERDEAMLNDEALDFALLHHYATRDAQERELAEQGFELAECLDLEGRALLAGEEAPECPELHYTARPQDPADGGGGIRTLGGP